MEEIQKTEIHYVEKNSSIYPARLRELSGMPKQLYYIGRFPEDNKPTAAIVGARLCSAYGRIQAFRYGKFLSEHGVQVISGMAAGIDAEGHKGALEGITPEYCVRYALKQMKRRKVVIVPTLTLKAVTTCGRFIPQKVLIAITAHQQKKKLRAEDIS